MVPGDQIETVELPGRTTLRKTFGIPPREIALPFIAVPRFRWAHVAGVLVTILFAWAAFDLFEWVRSEPSIYWVLKFIAAILTCVFVLFCAGVVATEILDAASPNTMLAIDNDGLTDTRQPRTALPWGNVEAIGYLSMRTHVSAVLKLKAPVSIKYNPFRFGHGFRRSPRDQLHVSIDGLDRDLGDIMGVMDAMVARNGGRVTSFGDLMGSSQKAAT